MSLSNERLPRAVELAAEIVANHVRTTATPPQEFAQLLQLAYEGIKALEAKERKRAPAAQPSTSAATAAPGMPRRRGRPPKHVNLEQQQAALDLEPRAKATLPPDEDRATGYIRNGVRTVYDDRIVCLEDGREVTFLRRHLRAMRLDETAYRTRWDLPDDYPMTTPDYVTRKKEAARESGFGTTQRPHRENKSDQLPM